MVLRKKQKPSLALTVALFSLLFINSNVCYSDTVVPKLSNGNSSGWSLNNMTQESDCWSMKTIEASAETEQYYDFDVFSSIKIEAVTRTYFSFTNCTTRLEISTDGINWNPIATFEHSIKNSTGKTFTITTTLPYKQAKLRLIATNANITLGWPKLVSLEITGIPKFIPTPTGKEGVDITNNSFTCQWNHCNNATYYEVDLYRVFPGKKEKMLLEEDFRNQTTSSTGTMDNELSTYLPKWNGSNVYFVHKNIENLKYLKIGRSNATGFIATPPLNLSGNGGEFKLSFDIGSSSKIVSSKINLYINNRLTQIVTAGITNELPTQRFTLPFLGGTEKCIIKFEGAVKSDPGFLIDNITITQLLDGVETSLPGYPIIVKDTIYSITDFAPNTTYYYTVKASNGYITTNKSEPTSIKTLSGEQITIDSDTEKTFQDETIEGDLCIKEGAIVRGKVTVKGEVSYLCRLTTGKWHSFSLPFIPRIVGGYIEGKRYALRTNYDYQLKSYQNGGFTNTELGERGYIIKVSPHIDNGELFFFSNKGITLNETTSINMIEEGYSHLPNPYTFSINPRDLALGDKFYCLKDNKYVETTNELPPFQSVIVYKESKVTRPLNAITIESGITDLPIDENTIPKIWKEGNFLRIKSSKESITIYTSKGEIIYNGIVNESDLIPLPKGLYLVKIKDFTSKITF
ncbi:hypothetical protein [Bacteroides sedimenti]|uniref:F5/8 type C domain-containing protein n=1 Tax=Bacteroides sedimenti TaxID=2136147 RepID=A0ABN6Z5P1_9BACE